MCSVLVIDDTPDCREPVARLLRYTGHPTATAASGPEALAYLAAHRPDVILLDLMMPEMDGVSFLRILRSNPQWRDLPVIILSALSEGVLIDEARQLGVQQTLLKSRFSADQLLACVDELSPNLTPPPPVSPSQVA